MVAGGLPHSLLAVRPDHKKGRLGSCISHRGTLCFRLGSPPWLHACQTCMQPVVREQVLTDTETTVSGKLISTGKSGLCPEHKLKKR